MTSSGRTAWANLTRGVTRKPVSRHCHSSTTRNIVGAARSTAAIAAMRLIACLCVMLRGMSGMRSRARRLALWASPARGRTCERLLASPPPQVRCFVGTFTAIGVRRQGYDPRRDPVSMLAVGRTGWLQRTNFLLTGSLYLAGAAGRACSPRRAVGRQAPSVLVGAAGVGLVGYGVFVTDPVSVYPSASTEGQADSARRWTASQSLRAADLRRHFPRPGFCRGARLPTTATTRGPATRGDRRS
jgi:Protein of unknown function (DUF998)